MDVSAVPDSSGSVKADLAEIKIVFGVSGSWGSIVMIDVSVISAIGCCTMTGSDSVSRGMGSGGTIGGEQMRLVDVSGVLSSIVFPVHVLHE